MSKKIMSKREQLTARFSSSSTDKRPLGFELHLRKEIVSFLVNIFDDNRKIYYVFEDEWEEGQYYYIALRVYVQTNDGLLDITASTALLVNAAHDLDLCALIFGAVGRSEVCNKIVELLSYELFGNYRELKYEKL